MKKVYLAFALLILSTLAFAGSEEDAALRDWESVQKSYKQNQVFEKIEERKYRIRNDGLGYDGELIVQNIIVEEPDYYGEQPAIIVTKLSKPSEELEKNYGISFSRWQDTNTVYFDKNKSKWVRYKDLTPASYANNCEKTDKTDYLKKFKGVFFAVLPVFLILMVFYVFLKIAQKKQVVYVERAKNHMDEVENTLKEILKALNKNA